MAIKVSGTTVVDDSRNITNVIGVGDTATTLFYGDGSGLSNTGAVLSAGSGSQRLVVTSGTSGIMTTAATNANLTWDSTSGTLSATNVSIAGTLTYEDVTNVDSIGIVTARQGIDIKGGIGATFADNVKAFFGTGGDLQIYHDGSDSYITDVGTGDLVIKGVNLTLTSDTVNINNAANTENLIRAFGNGAVELYYDNSKKLETLVGGAQCTGDFTATGNVTGYSDETLKDNIQTIPDALSKVTQLRGVEFDRNDIEGNPHQIGIIAQEVEKVIPEVVTTHDDGIKSVAYGNLVGVLIEAIKELKEEVNELKARLEEV